MGILPPDRSVDTFFALWMLGTLRAWYERNP
jgi:hypothetical protein